MKTTALQAEVSTWAVMGLVGIAAIYAFIKWGLPAIGRAAADTASKAARAATSSHDLSGSPVDYSGYGGFGVLGGATNTALGGAPASLGENIGGGLFSVFGPKVTGSNTYYRTTFPDGSVHAIGDAAVDANNRFQYGGVTYVLGDDGSGNKLATALTTIYGSGSGGNTANYGTVGDTTDPFQNIG